MTQSQSLSNVLCIWYPSGGFGHFINAILCLHAPGFVHTQNHIEFSDIGDSHQFDLILPKWHHNPSDYRLPPLQEHQRYTVLIDNGIDDQNSHYRAVFRDSPTLKICYDDFSWPVVAKTMIVKAMRVDLANEVAVDQHCWNSNQNWAKREKYFLYLRDHDFRHKWRPDPDCHNIALNDLMQYETMMNRLTQFGIGDSFYQDWQRWFSANREYLEPILRAHRIIARAPEHNECLRDLSLWDQAVINYYVWLAYGVEIPANDYADWFTNSSQIYDLVFSSQ